ncbi:MAG: GntR family transcriptional regulator [Candidatus Hydrothermota bacterium]|nr:MAG: GntR family transcriptional regulator [Candidatus Hydrothermae bacterium]
MAGFEIEFEESRPIYMQIMDMLKRAMARGELRPGDKLPSVREMAQIVKVNPNTVQRAYMELEREGFIVTKRGQGSFVTDHTEIIQAEKERRIQESINRLLAEFRELGLSDSEIKNILQEVIDELGH